MSNTWQVLCSSCESFCVSETCPFETSTCLAWVSSQGWCGDGFSNVVILVLNAFSITPSYSFSALSLSLKPRYQQHVFYSCFQENVSVSKCSLSLSFLVRYSSIQWTLQDTLKYPIFSFGVYFKKKYVSTYLALLFMWIIKFGMLEQNCINEMLKIRRVLWNGN